MRRSFSFLAKLSFSLLLLGAVLSRIDFHKLPTYFADVNPSMLVLALLLAMLQVPATSLRWHLLLLTVGVRLPMRTMLEVNIISIFANSVLGNVVGGIVIAIVLGGMTFVGLWMLGIYPHVDAHMLLRMTSFGLLGLMAVAITAYTMSKQFRAAVDQANATILHAMIIDWRGLAVAFVLTLVSQLLLVGVLIGHVMHVTVPLWQMAMILPGVALISSLPIGLGGGGLREISMVTILAAMGVSAEQSLALSITIGAVTLGGSAAAYGLVLAARTLERP